MGFRALGEPLLRRKSETVTFLVLDPHGREIWCTRDLEEEDIEWALERNLTVLALAGKTSCILSPDGQDWVPL